MKLNELDNYDNLLKAADYTAIQVSNKTRDYILPALFLYGNIFLTEIRNYSFVAVGVRDDNRSELYNENRIGLLFNVKKSYNTNFKSLGKGYVTDYYFGELLYGHLHMVVIELPEKFHDVAIKAFLRSEYSKIYTDSHAVFHNSNVDGEYYLSTQDKCFNVCIKSETRKLELEEKLAGAFIAPILSEEAELDDKINLSEEVFNYNNNKNQL
jgi:hypothetical protein